NPTSLESEYLLNENNQLEIKKVIKATGKSITKSSISVHLVTQHPNIKGKPLITLKQQELQKLVEEYKSQIRNYEQVSKSKKADMRKTLFEVLINEETTFEEKSINIKDIQDDSIKTWDKLKSHLHLFTLFQSDRENTDADKEVQDPMKAIIKEVLGELQPELDEIQKYVVNKVEEIGNHTIEKLKEFNPDIAGQLKTIPDLK